MNGVERRSHSFTCRLGRPLSYVEAGSGPPLMIVNAYGVSVKLWDKTIDLLGQQFRVLSWNMRGFVEGEYDLKFTLKDHAADLIEILGHAGIDDVHLLAYCSGTKVALEATAALGPRLRSLTFVGGNFWPLPGYGPMQSRFANNLRKLAQIVKKRPFLAPIIVTMMTGRASALPMVAENLAIIAEEYRDLVVAPFATKGAVVRYADLVIDYYDTDATAQIDALDVPTLVIGASADAIIDPDLSPAAAARIRGAKFINIPSFNHFAMVEAPETLAKLVADFTGRWESRRPS